MSFTVNTNLLSSMVQQNLNANQASLGQAMERLSSGLRINSAKDDAAGFAISQRFTSQIQGTQQATRNANDAISMTQTAGGALTEIGNNLQRMRDLAVQAANATNSASDRASINNEVQALAQEIDRVAQSTSFNGTNLLDGSFTGKNFQVGANTTASDQIQISSISSARITALGGVTGTASANLAGSAAVGGAAMAAGDLTLNGIQVGASTQGGSAGQSAGSAFSIAAAINAAAGQTGVTATAQATTVTGGIPAASAAIAANTFSINGVNVGAVAAGGDAIGQGANVAAAINKISSQTGVTASADNAGKVTLTAADGRDIAIGGTITNTGLTAATTHSTISLNSTAGFMVSGGGLTNLSLAAGAVTATPGATVSTIATMDVLTATSASQAINTIDGALANINSSQAALGAYQNRFTSVVAVQASTIQNLTTSQSRIQDADFAQETANLSRAQVLQQAGTAMLAQANQSSQGVLSLLR
jgi:flagellin